MTRDPEGPERAKQTAARAALAELRPGMKIGLGTGSTAAWFLRELARLIRQDGMRVVGVPTSVRTGEMAERLGIPLTTLDEAGWLDLTVDGADEIGPGLTLIKGGGGALLQEKIVAAASDRMVVIADQSKLVDRLGAFPLPVEVVPFGWQVTRAMIEEVMADTGLPGQRTTLRMNRDEPFVTDEGHFILDLHCGLIERPGELAAALTQLPGVVETGLFVGMADLAIVGAPDGSLRRITPDGETGAATDLLAPPDGGDAPGESLFRGEGE
ncbi:MAG: ribose-5-phosphate isomerase A [Paracoccaceae bacterium]|nr:MAG: ribose-5-phosphate isomerase A [Paracoccaceae bacterium]